MKNTITTFFLLVTQFFIVYPRIYFFYFVDIKIEMKIQPGLWIWNGEMGRVNSFKIYVQTIVLSLRQLRRGEQWILSSKSGVKVTRRNSVDHES